MRECLITREKYVDGICSPEFFSNENNIFPAKHTEMCFAGFVAIKSINSVAFTQENNKKKLSIKCRPTVSVSLRSGIWIYHAMRYVYILSLII